MHRFMKKAIAFAATGCLTLLVVSPCYAATTPSVCAQALDALKREWAVVDYPAAYKVTSTEVHGRYGHENTPGQIAFMKDEMKKAEAECASGNQHVALQRISSIQDVLDAHGDSQATANAAMIEK